ncbi:hypothetical protein ACVWXO_008192 [Bradyrhizobium sp. LM2.7]
MRNRSIGERAICSDKTGKNWEIALAGYDGINAKPAIDRAPDSPYTRRWDKKRPVNEPVKRH